MNHVKVAKIIRHQYFDHLKCFQSYLEPCQAVVELVERVLASDLVPFLAIILKARVAEVGSLSARAKMVIKTFVKRVLTIFATNASFLRVIANLQIRISMICNIYHVIVHFLSKRHCF